MGNVWYRCGKLFSPWETVRVTGVSHGRNLKWETGVARAHFHISFAINLIFDKFFSSRSNPMTLTTKCMQQRVDEWINQFEEGYWPPLSMLASIVEEIGELSREINSLEKIKSKKNSEPVTSLSLEIGDILFSLICLANYYSIDLEESFNDVMEKYSKRDMTRWTKKKNM
jgi:NTP pyrophosphatase (non-canonical NTP hydrolase)